MSPDDEREARILAAVAEAAGPTRAQVQRRTAVVLAAALAGGIAIFSYAGGFRLGGEPRPLALTALTFGGTLVIAATALRLAYGRTGSALGPPRVALVAIAVLTPLLAFVWKVGVSLLFDGATEWLFPERIGLKCLVLSLSIASVLATALLFVRRGTDPVHPRLTGAALGVTAGAVAVVLTDLWCPVGHPVHVLVGHIVPIGVHGVVGALVGGWILGVRRS